MKKIHFEAFFSDPIYLLYKNHLYNYLCRRFVVRRRLRHSPPGRILELGCGVSPMLKEGRGIIQSDVSWQALRYLKGRVNASPIRLVACDATRFPFLGRSFDCVICSEMLEHVKEDGQVLREIAKSLKPGGELLLTCPVHAEYFGFDDEFVGHYRRYEIIALREQLEREGFSEIAVEPILGFLEKQIMERITRFFALSQRQANGPKQGGLLLLVFAWIFFPLYLVANYTLAFAVYLQARTAPLKSVVTVLVRCRKQS